CVGLAAASVLSWLVFGSARGRLVQYLGEVGIEDGARAAVARFSQNEVGIFAFMLAISVLLILLVLSGWFSGSRARLAALALGTWLVLDLGRANGPWIVHYNWQQRYATNPVFDILRAAPQEGRVTGRLPFQVGGEAGRAQRSMSSVYEIEWLQHQFRYYDIQSLDIVQMPRTKAEFAAYKQSVFPNPMREWELGNTRYLLSLAPMA